MKLLRPSLPAQDQTPAVPATPGGAGGTFLLCEHSTEYRFASHQPKPLGLIQISWNYGLASRLKSQISMFFFSFFLKQPFYFNMYNPFCSFLMPDIKPS